MVHGSKKAGPEEFLTGVWVAMVAGVVEIVDVFEESRDLARPEEDGDKVVLLAVCT
jgi:hypothetical protein